MKIYAGKGYKLRNKGFGKQKVDLIGVSSRSFLMHPMVAPQYIS